jgi:hypothetical protein
MRLCDLTDRDAETGAAVRLKLEEHGVAIADASKFGIPPVSLVPLD